MSQALIETANGIQRSKQAKGAVSQVNGAGNPSARAVLRNDGAFDKNSLAGASGSVGGFSAGKQIKTVRIGLLGLGRVGQAVAQLCETARETLRKHGVELCVTGIFIRNENRARAYQPSSALVTNQEKAFLARKYDVVIEALGGVEPARALVTHFLQAGVPVVTANKSLLAAHGEALFALARKHDTELRCEASAIAGVPFLAALRSRPLAARVENVAAILNGTSNYVLSKIANEKFSFAQALEAANRRGLAEPDAARDLDGTDTAEKLIVLLQHLGISGVAAEQVEKAGIQTIIADDLQQARAFGGTIKPVACAKIGARNEINDVLFIEAFVGPAFVEAKHRLAAVEDEQNGLFLRGSAIGELFYSGLGAGPNITAATILDDVVEIVAAGFAAGKTALVKSSDAKVGAVEPVSGRFLSQEKTNAEPVGDRFHKSVCQAPRTGWFVRLDFPQAAPVPEHLGELLGSYGVWLRRCSEVQAVERGARLYVLTHGCSREALEAALLALKEAVGCAAFSLRVLDGF